MIHTIDREISEGLIEIPAPIWKIADNWLHDIVIGMPVVRTIHNVIDCPDDDPYLKIPKTKEGRDQFLAKLNAVFGPMRSPQPENWKPEYSGENWDYIAITTAAYPLTIARTAFSPHSVTNKPFVEENMYFNLIAGYERTRYERSAVHGETTLTTRWESYSATIIIRPTQRYLLPIWSDHSRPEYLDRFARIYPAYRNALMHELTHAVQFALGSEGRRRMKEVGSKANQPKTKQAHIDSRYFTNRMELDAFLAGLVQYVRDNNIPKADIYHLLHHPNLLPKTRLIPWADAKFLYYSWKYAPENWPVITRKIAAELEGDEVLVRKARGKRW